MQQTRQHILDILRENGDSTVDDIVSELQKRRGRDITAVTVRHHLARLQEEDMIASPQLRHRNTPGRPQHVYTLTEKAINQFPNNYQRLAEGLLQSIREKLPPSDVNVIIEGVAENMAQQAQIPDLPLQQRLDVVVKYLDEQGYSAHWEPCAEGFTLYTTNCPYHKIAETDHTLCEMDIRLVAALLGVVPRRVGHIMNGDLGCAYLIPKN